MTSKDGILSPIFNMAGLFLHENLSGAPGLADDFADGAVGHGGGVEDDGLQLLQIDLAVGEDAFIGAHVHHFADEDAVGPADHLAFQRERILLDDGRIHVRAGREGETDLGHFVRDLAAAYQSEIVGLRHRADIGETHGEGAGDLQILRGLVLGHAHDDLLVIVLPGPGGHHHVRRMVLVPGRDHHARLGRGHKSVVRSEILAAGDFVECFLCAHINFKTTVS